MSPAECTPLSHYARTDLINTGADRGFRFQRGLMRRNKLLTFSLVVFGAVLIGAVAPYSQLGRSAQDNLEVPTVSAAWTVTSTAVGTRSDLAHVTAVVPPYIILEAIPYQGKYAERQLQLRISIQTMSGSYSDYLASTNTDNTESNHQPVHLAGSDGPGSIAGFPFVLIASN